MSNLGCIYYIYCKESGKGYVGQHNQIKPDERFRAHRQRAKSAKSSFALYNAMKKYGLEKFTVETLCVVPFESLSRMEAYWAEQLETYIWDIPGGYNMIWCGDEPRRGILHTKEAKEKMSKAQKGKFVSEETKQKQSLALKGLVKSDEHRKKLAEANMGKIRTEESKKKQAESNKGTKRSEECKQKQSGTAKKLWEEGRSPIIAALQAQQTNEFKEKRKKLLIERNKSDEQKQKTIAFHTGRKRSEETCRRISEARKASFARKKELQLQNQSISSEVDTK
jgi:group I intron endonuclease